VLRGYVRSRRKYRWWWYHRRLDCLLNTPIHLFSSYPDPFTFSLAYQSSFAGRRVSNRHIRLCEAKNQVYQYDPDEGVSTPSDIWYNKDQLEQFRQDAQDQGRVTETQERGSHDPSWSLALFQTYQSFCRVESAHDMDRIYSALSKLEAIDPHLVGLELHAIPQLSHARGQRRSQLMAQINRVQSCTDMSKSERTRRIRKLSHEASRPSRLFALHLAARVQV
jgi:hypothetical protein